MTEVPLLDTNILIATLNDSSAYDGLFVLESAYVSAMSVMELFALSGMSAREEKAIMSLINTLTVIPIEKNISIRAGKMARTKTNRRHRADLILAATAIEFNLTLLTNNTKDFKGIRGLRIESFTV